LGVRVDAVEEWSRAQQRVIDLVAGLPAERAAQRVPACPDWTVRDLLSHMVGLGADVVAGDEPDDHNAEWTSRQVQARRDRDVPALVAEWRAVAEPLRAWMRANTVRPLNDVLIHEQDLRGALGVPGGQDAEGWAAILGDDGWAWVSRGGADGVGGAAVVLRAPTFDLTRALVTRRSAAQLTGWTVRGDVGPYLDAFAMLGPLPSTDLAES
jgi:uncharacterized protein (TIGR03083 family)